MRRLHLSSTGSSVSYRLSAGKAIRGGDTARVKVHETHDGKEGVVPPLDDTSG